MYFQRTNKTIKSIIMKSLQTLLLAAFLTPAVALLAADVGPATPESKDAKPKTEQSVAAKELQGLVEKVSAKLKDGKKTEADLADELKEFDVLLARHKGEKTDDVAQIVLMKAILYLNVMDQTDKGMALIRQLKTDYPETKQGKGADEMIARIEAAEEGKKIQSTLMPGSKFPDFAEKDLEGKPLSIAGYKGKVVLVDFWATWCGPCVRELPNVLATYEKYHADGFDVVGISLDSEEKKLKDFIEAKKMPWRQYFDGKGWENKLGAKYGVKSIPATYLIDPSGNIIATGLRGEELEKAVAKALAKK
ncbi:MAG: hypothetical protein QOF48_3061 [Verrucomicrobiota bacterium]